MRKTEKQGMKEKVTAINFGDAFPEYDKEKPYRTANVQIRLWWVDLGWTPGAHHSPPQQNREGIRWEKKHPKTNPHWSRERQPVCGSK